MSALKFGLVGQSVFIQKVGDFGIFDPTIYFVIVVWIPQTGRRIIENLPSDVCFIEPSANS
jgi:hypothetical protein